MKRDPRNVRLLRKCPHSERHDAERRQRGESVDIVTKLPFEKVFKRMKSEQRYLQEKVLYIL